MSNFLDHFAEIASDAIVIAEDEDGLYREAQANLWSFSLDAAEAAALAPNDVPRFLDAIVTARNHQLLERCGRGCSMLFSCRFDEQAAQLRFSLVSTSHGRLPFGGRVNVVDDPRPIIETFVRSPYHAGILWAELEPHPLVSGAVMAARDLGAAPPSLDVWVQQRPLTV